MTIHIFGDSDKFDAIMITLDPKDVEHMIKGNVCRKKPSEAPLDDEMMSVPGFMLAIVEDENAHNLADFITKDLYITKIRGETEYYEGSGE